ncbi:hypothetical protein Fmac_003504 [Flemingia macrophylla]|uniref:Uncharacterized protein n=1 Tax=Flemingia macrophylla TaxID=520843 RepID=A0ABD1NN02_9FABA
MRIVDMKNVSLAFHLKEFRFTMPPTLLQSLIIRHRSFPRQRVPFGGANKKLRTSKPSQGARTTTQWVYQWVVEPTRPIWTNKFPNPSGRALLVPQHRFTPNRLRTEEVGMRNNCTRKCYTILRPSTHANVVCYVTTSAVTPDEHSVEITVFHKPRVGVVRIGHPFKSMPAIIVRRRKRCLWCQPVLHRHRYNTCCGHYHVEIVLVLFAEGGFEEKPTTVKVHQDGDFVVV